MFCRLAPFNQALWVVPLVLAGVLAPWSGYAQSRSAASQFNSVSINDQIQLQILTSIVQEMNNSLNHNCTKPAGGTPAGTLVNNGQTWTTTVCPIGQTGTTTNICISGYNVLQSTTCN